MSDWKMFKKYDDTSSDFSKRGTKSLHRTLAESQPGSINHQKALAELDFRASSSSERKWIIGVLLTLAGVAIAALAYLKG